MVISTLPGIWTPASPSAWPIQKNGKVFVRSGAGIVADSVPEKEYAGMHEQGKGVLESTGDGAGGIEL